MYISLHNKYKSVAPCVFTLHQYRPCIYHVYCQHIFVYTIDNWHILVLTFCFQDLVARITQWHPLAPPSDGLVDNVRRIWWSWFWYSLYKNLNSVGKIHVQYVQAGGWWVLVNTCILRRSSSIFIVYTIHIYWIFKVYK